jgi:hypothetical protein
MKRTLLAVDARFEVDLGQTPATWLRRPSSAISGMADAGAAFAQRPPDGGPDHCQCTRRCPRR